MPRLRAALYGCASALLAAAPAAFGCAMPHQAAIFDVAGLKSELMVTAISCDADAQYNAFVTRFRSLLLNDDQELAGYFSRIYGRAAQAAHDAYITNVANKMSEVGVAEGTDFCRRHMALFSEVLALSTSAQLELFALSRGYGEPVAPARCPTSASAPAEVAQEQR